MSTTSQLAERIHRDLEELRTQLAQFLARHELSGHADEAALDAKIEDLHVAVEALAREREQGFEPAARAVATLGALDAALNYFDARLTYFANVGQSIQQSVLNAWSALKNYLQPIIQNISQQLWQLIVQLQKLKEWSVTGNTGVSLFGLSGAIQLELTFER